MERLTVGQLGPITRLAAGGQGVVYAAPGVRMPYAAALVYKEYRSETVASLNIAVLEAMPAYLESLPFIEGMQLMSRAAWPCRLVERAPGSVSGFVMPAIPAEFYIDMTKSSGIQRVTAEFQHLLNDKGFLTRRGIALTDRLQYELIAETANALNMFHRHGISVGDLSPKNLLFDLHPQARVYFIDCDAMRSQGRSVAPQMETPGWDVHSINPSEELATGATDIYKMGLLALRLLAGDQFTRDVRKLPTSTPQSIRSLITTSLAMSPAQRPSLAAWQTAALTAAATASTTAPARPTAPPQRPTPPSSLGRPPTGHTYSPTQAATSTAFTKLPRRRALLIGAGIFAAAIALTAIVNAPDRNSAPSSSTGPASTYVSTSILSPSSPTTAGAMLAPEESLQETYTIADYIKDNSITEIQIHGPNSDAPDLSRPTCRVD